MRPKFSGRRPLIDRINEKIAAPAGPKNCRLWTGAIDRNRTGMQYGVIEAWDETTAKWAKKRVTRELWRLLKGEIPPETPLVLHTCDESLCCEIEHLYLGTHADNMQDMTSRGRAASGERNGRRLHPEITERGKQAGWYSHPNHAKGDQNGSHTHPERVARGEKQGLSKLTDDKVREIRRLYAAHEFDQYELAAMFGVRQTNIGFIVRRETWKHVE